MLGAGPNPWALNLNPEVVSLKAFEKALKSLSNMNSKVGKLLRQAEPVMVALKRRDEEAWKKFKTGLENGEEGIH